jgi:cbb3-type cytochrome oxidase subunit 1
MCAQRPIEAVVVKLPVSRLFVVENIRVGFIDWGSIAVYTGVSATVCRWWREWRPVVLP